MCLAPFEVRRALRYGRVVFACGASHFILDCNEVGRDDSVQPDDKGLQLVVSSLSDGVVVTLYRNKEDISRPEDILSAEDCARRSTISISHTRAGQVHAFHRLTATGDSALVRFGMASFRLCDEQTP